MATGDLSFAPASGRVCKVWLPEDGWKATADLIATGARGEAIISFNDRLAAQADARKAALEKFRARPAPDDPAVLERIAAQKAVAEAREKRAAERKAEREAEKARLAAEEAARKAEAEARAREEAEREKGEAERIANLDADKKARALALAAEQKAKRDARYAARKARNR